MADDYVRERDAPTGEDPELAALLKKRNDRVGAVDELDRGVEGTKQQLVELFEAASEEQWRMTQDILRIENEGNLAPLLNLRAMSDLQYARVDLRDVQSQVDEILHHFTTAAQSYVAELDQHVEYMKSKMVAYKESLDNQRGSLDGMKRRYEACLERMRKNDIQMDFLRGQVIRREAMLHDQRSSYLKELNMYKELLFTKRQKGEDFNVEKPVVDVLGGQGEVEPLMAQLERAMRERKAERDASKSGSGSAAASRQRVEQQWQQTLDTMKRHHAQELRSNQEEFERILAEKDAVIARCEQDARDREEQYRADLEEYAAMQSEGAEEARRQLEEDLELLRNDFAVEKTALIAAHDEALATCRAEHEAELTNARGTLEADLERANADLERVAQELRAKVDLVDTLDADVARLQAERDEALDAAGDAAAGRAAREADLQRKVLALEAHLEEMRGKGSGGGGGGGPGGIGGGPGSGAKGLPVSRHAYEDLAGCYMRLETKWGAHERLITRLKEAGIVTRDNRIDFDALEGAAERVPRDAADDSGDHISLPNDAASAGTASTGTAKKGGKRRPSSAKPKRPLSAKPTSSSKAGSVAGSDAGSVGSTAGGGGGGGGLHPAPPSTSGGSSRPSSAKSGRGGVGGRNSAHGTPSGSQLPHVPEEPHSPSSSGNHAHNNNNRARTTSSVSSSGRSGSPYRPGSVITGDEECQTPLRWLEDYAIALARERGLFANSEAGRLATASSSSSSSSKRSGGADSDSDDGGDRDDNAENDVPLTNRADIAGGGRRGGGGGGGGGDIGGGDIGDQDHLRQGIDNLTAAVAETDELRSRRAVVNWELMFKGVVTLAIQAERQRALALGAPSYEADRDIDQRISSLQVFDRMEARASHRLRRARNRLQMIEEERRRNMEKVMAAARLLVDPEDTRRDTFAAREAAYARANGEADGSGEFTTLRLARHGEMSGSTAPLSFRQRPASAAAVVSRHGAAHSGTGHGPHGSLGVNHPARKTAVLHSARLSAGGVSYGQRATGAQQQQQQGDDPHAFPTPEPFDPNASGYGQNPIPPSHPRPKTAPDNGAGGGRRQHLTMPRLGGFSGQGNNDAGGGYDGAYGYDGHSDDLMRIQSMTHRGREHSPPRAIARRVKTPVSERRSGKNNQSVPSLSEQNLRVNFTNLSQAERRDMVLRLIYRDAKMTQLRKRDRGDGRPGTGARGKQANSGGSGGTGGAKSGKGPLGTPVVITRLGGERGSSRPRTGSKRT